MNQERIATYVGGLIYKKPKQQIVKQPIASHLKLLKEKIRLSIDPQTYSLQIPHTSLTPDKNLSHSPLSYHMEHHQEH